MIEWQYFISEDPLWEKVEEEVKAEVKKADELCEKEFGKHNAIIDNDTGLIVGFKKPLVKLGGVDSFKKPYTVTIKGKETKVYELRKSKKTKALCEKLSKFNSNFCLSFQVICLSKIKEIISKGGHIDYTNVRKKDRLIFPNRVWYRTFYSTGYELRVTASIKDGVLFARVPYWSSKSKEPNDYPPHPTFSEITVSRFWELADEKWG